MFLSLYYVIELVGEIGIWDIEEFEDWFFGCFDLCVLEVV